MIGGYFECRIALKKHILNIFAPAAVYKKKGNNITFEILVLVSSTENHISTIILYTERNA